MRLTDFDFPLPEHLIAKEPLPERGASRLMALEGGASPGHLAFSSLPGLLMKGDMLLLNNTRVVPCGLRGAKPAGGMLDVLLVREIMRESDGGHAPPRWEVLSVGGYSGPLRVGAGLSLTLHKGREAELHYEGSLRDILDECGMMPVPPYLKRRPVPEDRNWYQTVYAEREGSIAAPTAGLHFTRAALSAIEARGVAVRYLTLHVGRGTFAPVRAGDVEGHRMEPEHFEIPLSLLDEIAALPGRLVTVGTTATRAIEGFLSGRYESTGESGGMARGSTDIFIHPGYEFKAVKGMLTNFHLPRSTPLMLAAALAGRQRLLEAYVEAVGMGYRFFTYGDAMLII